MIIIPIVLPPIVFFPINIFSYSSISRGKNEMRQHCPQQRDPYNFAKTDKIAYKTR